MSHTDCGCCTVLYSEPYKELGGPLWYYRVLDNQTIQRSSSGSLWTTLKEEDYANMTLNHLEFVESLTL